MNHREQVIALLGQILQNNVGNRLTEELATGIATTVNHHLMQAEVAQAPKNDTSMPASEDGKRPRLRKL